MVRAPSTAAISSHFDVILMDCQMPVLDGFAATTQDPFCDVADRIIGMTASATGKAIRERCRTAGMDDCIVKPLSVAVLTDALARWSPDAAAPAVIKPQIADSLGRAAGPAGDRQAWSAWETSSGEDVLGQLAVMFVDEAACPDSGAARRAGRGRRRRDGLQLAHARRLCRRRRRTGAPCAVS